VLSTEHFKGLFAVDTSLEKGAVVFKPNKRIIFYGGEIICGAEKERLNGDKTTLYVEIRDGPHGKRY
jgi:hypothetical protein